MMLLTRRFFWSLLGWQGLFLFTLLFLAAAQLSSSHTLGTQSLGDYLSFVSLAPIWLIYRACDLSHRKLHQQGWADEEAIRSPRYSRLALSEFLGAAVALITLLLLAGVAKNPAGGNAHKTSEATPETAYHSLVFQPTQTGHRVRARVWPIGSRLHLTLQWGSSPNKPPTAGTHSSFGTLTPGEMVVVNPHEIQIDDDGYWVFDFSGTSLTVGVDDPKLSPTMSRMAVPRPNATNVLPNSLFGMAAFFLPLLIAALALIRHTSLRPLLATATALTFGWMTTWPPLDFPNHASAITRTVWQATRLLPDLAGLLPVGHNWELRYGTTSIIDSFIWLFVFGGLTLFALLRQRRRPKS